MLAISILAPAWGASLNTAALEVPELVFQFSPPRGGRRGALDACGLPVDISILAPAWGASLQSPKSSMSFAYFNSRPRVGGVLYALILLQYSKYFNSRPRVGGVCKFIQMKSAVYVQNGRNEDCKLLPIIGLWVNPLKINGRLCAD